MVRWRHHQNSRKPDPKDGRQHPGAKLELILKPGGSNTCGGQRHRVVKGSHSPQGATDPPALIAKYFCHSLFARPRIYFLSSHGENAQREGLDEIAFTAGPHSGEHRGSDRAERKKRPGDPLKDLGILERAPALADGTVQGGGE